MLLLTVGHVGGYGIELESDASFGGFRGSIFTVLGHAQAESVTFTTGYVDVDVQATIYVAWKDLPMPREPVDLTLEKIVKCMTNIVPRFERFFLP